MNKSNQLWCIVWEAIDMFQSQLEGKTTASQQINALGAALHIVRHPGEMILADAFMRLYHEGQVPIVWHARPGLTMSDFLEQTKAKDSIFYICLVESIETGQIESAGLGWATDIVELVPGSYRCSSGMVFLKKYQDRKFSMEFCEMMIDDGFDTCGMAVQYGYSPVPNRAACLFHRAMQFDILAIAPDYSTWDGKPCDVQMSVITKERWALRDRKLARQLAEVT
jgi:hypothetical protein